MLFLELSDDEGSFMVGSAKDFRWLIFGITHGCSVSPATSGSVPSLDTSLVPIYVLRARYVRVKTKSTIFQGPVLP